MKNTLLILVLTLCSIITFGQPKIKFDTTLFDFGDIHQTSGVLKGKFLFTNTGTEPLVINNAYSSGGIITVTNYPKDTIFMNQNGVIFFMLSIHSDSIRTSFTKSISIISNTTPSLHFLLVKGAIMPLKANALEEESVLKKQ